MSESAGKPLRRITDEELHGITRSLQICYCGPKWREVIEVLIAEILLMRREQNEGRGANEADQCLPSDLAVAEGSQRGGEAWSLDGGDVQGVDGSGSEQNAKSEG